MDSNTIILIINFILQVLQMFDHSCMKRLKSSKCFLGEIELNNNNDLEDSKKEKDTNNKI